MKRFFTILQLALAAVLTAYTPCEAKKHEVVVASMFVNTFMTANCDSCDICKSDMITGYAAINDAKDELR